MSHATLTQRRIKRYLSYPLQAVMVYALYGFFRLLPLDLASATGSWLLGRIGPQLGANRKVLSNIAAGLPALDAAEHQRIARGMWENLGRVLAEYPHLSEMDDTRVDITGREQLVALHDARKPFLMVGGHFANWEVLPVSAARNGLDLQLVYRHANNPYVDRLLARARSASGRKLARKGVEGARSVHGALRDNGAVGMLVDQKHNRGLSIPFLGRPAMTATAVAELALRYQAPIFMVQTERLQGARFRLTVHEPLAMPTGLSGEDAVRDILTRMNEQLGHWVRARPEQWLWLHRRWN